VIPYQHAADARFGSVVYRPRAPAPVRGACSRVQQRLNSLTSCPCIGVFRQAAVAADRPLITAPPMMAQVINGLAKGLDVLETAIHGGESNIAHFIQVTQLLHDQLADLARGTSRSRAPELVTYTADGFVNRRTAYRALLECPNQTGAELTLIKGSRLPSRLITRGISSSALSKVVKRSAHLRHSRRRGSDARRPSAASRTLVRHDRK